MKKSLWFAIFLMALSLVSFPLAIRSVDRGKEDIIITQKVYSGDPNVVKGITMRMASHWEGHLLWNTEYTVGSGREAQSSFAFASRHVAWGWSPEKSAVLRPEGGAGFGTAFTDVAAVVHPESLPFSRIIQAVADKAAAGEKYSGQVRIGDYFEYYPLVLDLEGVSVTYEGDFTKACEWMTDFFHISVAEDGLEVTVEKNPAGELVSVAARVNQEEQQINITGVSAFAEDGFYYTFALEDIGTGESVDRGQNSGIFFFPWKTGERDIQHLDLTQAKKACEYPGDGVPVELLLAEEEDRMYLVVRERGEYILCTYKIEQDVLIPEQTLSVGKSGADFCQLTLEEEGVLMTWEDNGFSFAKWEEGKLCLWCGGEFPRNPEETLTGGKPFPREKVCLFDGEKLVLAAYDGWQSMNVLLATYDRSGMIYSGLYYNGGKPDSTPPSDMSFYGIEPQGARIWRSYSSWSSSETDGGVKRLEILFEDRH